MKKPELINAIADATGVTKTDTERVLNELTNVVLHQLGQGYEITIPGLVKIDVVRSAERAGRNPQTGEPMVIAARNKPRFKALKALKDEVN